MTRLSKCRRTALCLFEQKTVAMKKFQTEKLRSQKRSGFTLLELLIVLAIILVIAAMVVPNLIGSQQKANEDGYNVSRGYGGKFGVETDRMDKSAVGHDYQVHTHDHLIPM